jgi:uncharacterized protein (DUF1697 family)
MERYSMALVVFLRGVNVGGHKTFRPSKIAKELTQFDVVNIGAAGTFVVRKPISQTKLRAELLRRLPFNAEIMICSAREILDLASADPFRDQDSGKDIVHFVSVLARRTTIPSVPLSLPSDDEWLLKVIEVRNRFVLGLYRRQMKVLSCFSKLEKQIGAPVTTRNWNTINAIVKILNGHPK